PKPDHSRTTAATKEEDMVDWISRPRGSGPWSTPRAALVAALVAACGASHRSTFTDAPANGGSGGSSASGTQGGAGGSAASGGTASAGREGTTGGRGGTGGATSGGG